MKRNIVINETRSALVISNNLTDAIGLVSLDSALGEEIYAFDTFLHVCYSFKAIEGVFAIVEEFIPLKDFRCFAKYNDNNYSKVYEAVISSVIRDFIHE